jgi:hypothetical protein
MKRLKRTLRDLCLIALTLVLVAAAAIRIQQHQLRHRAQLLLNDIQVLQLRPGAFSDLERLQQRWGAFGHSEGACSAQDCVYAIWLTSAEPAAWLANDELRYWTARVFSLLGGRPVAVMGAIIVHNDHMVLESFRVMLHVWAHEGTRPPLAFDGEYELDGAVRSASRLAFYGDYREADLKRGYKIGHSGACHGCVDGWVQMTPQTNSADIRHLGGVNLDCITRFRPCIDRDDLLPAAWADFRRLEAEPHERSYATKCSVPPALFAREADNAALAEVLRVHPPEYPNEERTQGATIRVTQSLKNGAGNPAGSIADISYGPQNVYAGLGVPSASGHELAAGERIILLFPQAVQGQPPGFIDTGGCSLFPLTDATFKSVREGIEMDQSGNTLKEIPIPY